MVFKLGIRLDRLAAIAVATSFVKNSSVQPILKEYVDRNHISCRVFDLQNLGMFTELLEGYIKEFKRIKLPRNVSGDVICIIKHLLARCIKWQLMVKKKFRFIYAGKIYWTCYGTIDTGKIVEKKWSSWFDANGRVKESVIDDLELPFTQYTILYLKFAMYYMACSCILTSYIKSHSSEIIQFCEDYYETLMCPQSNEIEYILYSVYFLSNFKTQVLNECKTKDRPVYKSILKNMKSWEKEGAFPSKMFSLSVRERSDIAARYYWGLLGSDEKHNSVFVQTDRIEYWIDLYHYKMGYTRSYNIFMKRIWRYQSDPSDTLIFLFTHMSENQLQDYFLCPEVLTRKLHISSYLKWIIDNWPWEELFFNVFEIVKVHITKQDAFFVLREIIDKMIYTKETVGFEFKNETHYRMFYAVFEEIRKRTANGELPLIPHFTKGEEFIKLFDFRILKLIKELECQNEESRKKFLEFSYDNNFGRLVRKNRFKEIEKFIKLVLTSDDERKWFIKHFEWHPDFVRNQEFEALDNLLSLQCESEEERRNCKYNAMVRADLMGICGYMFVQKLNYINEDIKEWGLSDENNRERYINNYKTEKLDWLNRIWKNCLEAPVDYFHAVKRAKRKTSQFLKWFWVMDDYVTKFKEEILTDQKVIMSFLSSVKFNTPSKFVSPWKILDDLLNFCLSPEGVGRFKHNVYSNIQDWFQFLISDDDGFYLLESDNFLDYVTDDPSKRQEAIKIFLHSESRFKFFLNLFNCGDFKNRAKWLSSWLKVGIEKNELKNYVNDISVNIGNLEDFSKHIFDLLRSR